MRKLIVCLLITFSVLAIAPAQKSEPKPNASSTSEIQTVAYCELLSNPEKYDRKIVRTTATYRFGFEWSEFYCLDCWDGKQRTWVEYDALCENSKKIKDNGFRGRTVNVQVVGMFFGAARMGYGHMNAYQYKFVVQCIEKAKTILNDSFLPAALPASVAKKASCTNSNSEH